MKNFCRSLLACCIFGLFFTVNLFGQDSLQQKIALKEITLDAARIKAPKRILPFALTYRTFPETQPNIPQNSLEDYLVGVPGLFAQNTQNFAQDLRLSIRGFGARAAFGIRGIQLIVDGIPETTPDGQGQLDNLPLGLINAITVLRGPAATFYGNASGGVIKINTLSDFENNFVRLRAQGGSYASSNLSATVGLKNNNTKAIFYQSLSQSDGYRDHSQYKQQVFNARVFHDFSSSSKLSAQFNFTHSPYAYDAGGINMASVQENRLQARPQNKSYKTFEAVDHLKTGLQWENAFSQKFSLSTYLFYAHRDFEGRLPFEFGGLVDLVRNYFGGGAALEYQPQDNHRLQIRVSFADQTDHRKRFKNIAGQAGDITLDQEEIFNNSAISILDEYRFSFGLLRAGLRFDRQKLGTNTAVNNTTLNIVNPSLGFTYTALGDHLLFACFATSFETPTLNELSANPSGEQGFNPNLTSSKANNFELGWRYSSPFGLFETTLYTIRTNNEILPYELEAFPGRSFYQNTGKTARNGIEIQWELQKTAWHWIVAFNYAALQFKDYQLDDKDLSRKKLPGVPQQQLFAAVSYDFSNGWGLMSRNQYNGALYTDNANQNRVSPYFVSNLKIWKSMDKFEFFGGVNNLFDRKYNDNIRINAWGSRYYEPAPLRNFYLGMNYTF